MISRQDPALVRSRSRSHRYAFTLVEVMVSIGIMTIGAMALIGVQQQVTRANVHARELTTATLVAQTWIERLKVDGMRWSAVSGIPATDLVGTDFLDNVAVAGMEGVFTAIPLSTANRTNDLLSDGFDFYGRDVPASNSNMTGVHFCVSYRLTWVFFIRTPVAPALASDDRALRADVRVWWPKERKVDNASNSGTTLAVDFPGCGNTALLEPSADGLAAPGAQFNNYHTVYLSTVIRPAA